MVTQAVYAAAQLGIADTLTEGPLTADEIAKKVDAHPEMTYRLMRMLAGYSLFAQRDDERFELDTLGEFLRSDSPMSVRPFALLMGHPVHWEDWAHFTETVRTGEPAIPKLRGMSTWEYVGSNPEYGAIFGRGMGNLSTLETESVLAAYDFTRFNKIVDVGGGLGMLLAAILGKATGATGVLSAPPSVEAAQAVLQQAGVADRCTIESASFLEAIPPGGDAYLVKHVVHDWPEAEALQILNNIRAAISPKGKLLVMEFVLPEGEGPHHGNLTDLWLHLLVGGKERTAEQYRQLLASAGFRMMSVTKTDTPLSIIEAEPA
jgi:hypothetical protein